MNYKEKLVAVMMQEFAAVDAAGFQRLLYSLCTRYMQNNIYFDFVMLAGGPHSFEAENIFTRLGRKDIISSKKRYLKDLSFEEKMAVQDLQIKGMNSQFLAPVVTQNDDVIFFTIGYEGISIDRYINKLAGNNIGLLCDVRKNAYSQKFGFSGKEMQNSLNESGIEYWHMPELGIVSEKRKQVNSASDKENLFEDYEKNVLGSNGQGLLNLQGLLVKYKRIAVTCFEADVNHCHRGRLAKYMQSLPGFNYPVINL